jgi:hypothetical protein
MVVGRALYIPWGSEPPIIAEETEGVSGTAIIRKSILFLNIFTFPP